MPKRRVLRHEVTQPSDTSYRLIPLTQGKNAIVDTKDFEWLSQWNWCAECVDGYFYAIRRSFRKRISMHGAILKIKTGEEGDHRNHDTLDNRRKNIRRCTRTQNARNVRKPWDNRSGF